MCTSRPPSTQRIICTLQHATSPDSAGCSSIAVVGVTDRSSSAWVAESTKAWTPNARRGIAYGYLWWPSMHDVQFGTKVGIGSYSARGNGGQYIVVAPARGIVVAHLNDRSENDKLESGEFNKLLQLIFAAAPQ